MHEEGEKMVEKKEPTRVQFQIGSSAPISLQQWVDNQSLSINKAVREVLNHFVYLYGTEDILSPEVREKMTIQQRDNLSPFDSTNVSYNQPTKDNQNNTTSVQESNADRNPDAEEKREATKKVIKKRQIDI